jgi:hypothetical protein
MTDLREDLRKWFGKGKKGDWIRVGTDGEIKGDCARDEGEGKPKCMPRSKAHSMSKDDRASAARRKRRADPEADRPGTGNKPIMVKTDKDKRKKVKKSIQEQIKSAAVRVRAKHIESMNEKLERDGPVKGKFGKSFDVQTRAALKNKGKTGAYLKKKRAQKDAQMKKNDPGQRKSMPNYTSNFVDKGKAVRKAGKRGLVTTPYDTMSGQKPNKMQKLQRGMKENEEL